MVLYISVYLDSVFSSTLAGSDIYRKYSWNDGYDIAFFRFLGRRLKTYGVENELPWTASNVGIAKPPVGTKSAEVFIKAATTGGAKFQRSRSKEQEDSALAPDMEYGGFKTTRLRQQLLQNSNHPGAFKHQYVRLLSRLE